MRPIRFTALQRREWMADVLKGGPILDGTWADLLRHVDAECTGTVKFFRADKGWGGIESDQTPSDVWMHFSTIEGPGERLLDDGDQVVFRWEPAFQDSWRCRATWVRKL